MKDGGQGKSGSWYWSTADALASMYISGFRSPAPAKMHITWSYKIWSMSLFYCAFTSGWLCPVFHLETRCNDIDYTHFWVLIDYSLGRTNVLREGPGEFSSQWSMGLGYWYHPNLIISAAVARQDWATQWCNTSWIPVSMRVWRVAVLPRIRICEGKRRLPNSGWEQIGSATIFLSSFTTPTISRCLYCPTIVIRRLRSHPRTSQGVGEICWSLFYAFHHYLLPLEGLVQTSCVETPMWLVMRVWHCEIAPPYILKPQINLRRTSSTPHHCVSTSTNMPLLPVTIDQHYSNTANTLHISPPNPITASLFPTHPCLHLTAF